MIAATLQFTQKAHPIIELSKGSQVAAGFSMISNCEFHRDERLPCIELLVDYKDFPILSLENGRAIFHEDLPTMMEQPRFKRMFDLSRGGIEFSWPCGCRFSKLTILQIQKLCNHRIWVAMTAEEVAQEANAKKAG